MVLTLCRPLLHPAAKAQGTAPAPHARWGCGRGARFPAWNELTRAEERGGE